MKLPLRKHLDSLSRIKNTQKSRLGYLRLNKNENIIDLPKGLLKEFHKQINSDFVSSYPDVESLYKKLAKYLRCKENNLYLSSGSDGAIKSVFEAFVAPKDKIVVLSPTYAMVYVYAKMFQANLCPVEFDSNLNVSAELILDEIKKQKPKLVFIANPNSPTGTVISPKDLQKIIRNAAKMNAVVLIDEAYFLFYSKSCAGLIKQYPNLVITRTFSKALGLASARLGFALAHEDMIHCLYKTRPMYETNAYGVRFAEIMLDNISLIRKNLSLAKEGKKYLESGLKKMGIQFYKSYANFVLFDVGSKQRAIAIAEYLNRKYKILVNAGFDFSPLQTCVRASIGTKIQMKRFLKVLKNVLSEVSCDGE